MSDLQMIICVFAMALVTYVIRMLPLTFFKKKIKSRYIRSVLYYIPYSVLSEVLGFFKSEYSLLANALLTDKVLSDTL